jgi:hypothetical protein
VSARRLALLAVGLPAFLALQALHWIGFLLDDLLVSEYREIRVRDPLFVVGLPRSGTSFLQRVLARDRERFTTLRLWELVLAPSIVERRFWLGLGRVDRAVGRPLHRLVDAVQTAAFRFMEDVHPVRFDEPEEDYFLLLPVFACFLQVLAFPDDPRTWELAAFDELPRRDRDELLAFYRECVQRHLHVAGRDRRLLSKNPSFTPMVRSLAATFPEARFICCVRDPREAVPSLLSSLEPAARTAGWSVRDPRYRDRFVEMMAYYGEHALRALPDAAPDRHVFVPLDRLSRDVEGVVLDAYAHLGLRASPDFKASLRERARSSREYESSHSYRLAAFGLDEDELVDRFQNLMETFGWSDAPDGSAGPSTGTSSPSSRTSGPLAPGASRG